MRKGLYLPVGLIVASFLLACDDFGDTTLQPGPDELSEGTKEVSSSSQRKEEGKVEKTEEESETKKEEESKTKKEEDVEKTEEEESETVSSSSQMVMTSSSQKRSSSSKAKDIVSSSSIPLITSEFGTCLPNPATVNVGEDVKWSFKWNTDSTVSLASVVRATYEWTFEGATPETSTERNVTTTYTTPGPKKATVLVAVNGMEEEASCLVHVNGAPITGCTCVPVNINPDVAVGESAQWSVQGCTASEGIDLSYTWAGASAESDPTVASAAVAVKGDLVTGVSVTVESTDYTRIVVPCDDARAVDSNMPEYTFEISGGQIPNQTLEVANGACMSVRGYWDNELFNPELRILCDGSAEDMSAGMTFSMTYNDKKIASASGSWGFALAGATIATLRMGDISIDGICVTFTGASTIKCKTSM